MTRLAVRSRLLVAMAALMLLATYTVPLWRIQLHAPQYPEGIGMLIRIDTITGIKPQDLDNINGLNHYIGMKTITPDVFPALRVMPAIVAVLAVLALLVAATGYRVLLKLWLGAIVAAGCAGFAEFYRWAYRYGHELAPDAIIKIPGMSYQPPIIGRKQLLNFTADSWPDVGGVLAMLAFVLGVVALLPLVRRTAPVAKARVLAHTLATACLLTLVLPLAGCAANGPTPIALGQADCGRCHMRIVDVRFAAEAVTAKGKIEQFDSIECLANFVAASRDARSLWVSDFAHPGTLIDATAAWYVAARGASSGMGSDLRAFSAASDTATIRAQFGSTPMRWSEAQRLVSSGGNHGA